MAYQPLEDLLPRANNSIYRLVRLASKRAQELSENGGKLITSPLDQKLTTTALEEIRQGRVIDKLVVDMEVAATAAAKKKK